MNGRTIIGFRLIDLRTKSQIDVSYKDAVSMILKDHNIQGIEIDPKTYKIRGDRLDLRKIKGIQYKNIAIQNKGLQDSDQDFQSSCKDLYFTKATDTLERVAVFKVQKGNKNKDKQVIKDIKADTLIIYADENQEDNNLEQIDYRTVKVKNIVFINAYNNLFNLLVKKVANLADNKRLIDIVIRFISDLNSISYIKTDNSYKFDKIAVHSRNTNWISNRKNDNTDDNFIESYTRMMLGQKLNISKYLSKLYNDRIVKQIISGFIDLSKLFENDKQYKQEIQFSYFNELMNNPKIRQGQRQLLAYQIDETSWNNGEPPRDYLIDLDSQVVQKILSSPDRLNTIKLLWQCNQFIKVHPSEKWVDGTELRENLLKVYNENTSLIKCLTDEQCELWDKIKVQKQLRGQPKDFLMLLSKFADKQVMEEVYRLDSKFKLLTSGGKLEFKDLKSCANFIESIIRAVKALCDRGNNSVLNYCIFDIVYRFITVYQNSCELIYQSEQKQVEIFGCITVKADMNYSYTISGDVLDISILEFQYKDFESMLKHPEYGFIITQLEQMGREVHENNLDIDLQNYKFYSLVNMNGAFSYSDFRSIRMSGFNFAKLENVRNAFYNQHIDNLIITDCAFESLYIDQTISKLFIYGNIVSFNNVIGHKNEFYLGEMMYTSKNSNESVTIARVRDRTGKIISNAKYIKTENMMNVYTDSIIAMYAYSNILVYHNIDDYDFLNDEEGPDWQAYQAEQEKLWPEMFARKARYDYRKYLTNEGYTKMMELNFAEIVIDRIK